MDRLRETLTQSRLKEFLHYDAATGTWTRRRGWKGCKAGDSVGYILPCGHRVISFCGKDYRSSHLAFLYMTGSLPRNQVDHKNVIPDDDRWDNLREATEAQNRRNVHAYRNNTTGFKGVSYMKKLGKFRATITFNWKQMHIGVFDSAEEAHQAYSAKAYELFGEFARTV